MILRPPPSRRRGFALLHMLVTLMLLGGFALAATRIFRLSILTSRSAAISQEQALRTEQALITLRSDVWQSLALEPVDRNLLKVRTNDGMIEWQTNGEGDLIRRHGEQQQVWKELNLAFERQGQSILLLRRDRELAVLQRGMPR